MEVISDNYFVSGSHDGSLRCWDIRKFQCIFEQPIHRGKYDEAVCSLAFNSEKKILISGGADGIVRMFEVAKLVS